jgi:hypothetical protein
LVLFHHDPDNDDAFVDGLVEKARQEFPQVTGATEGMEFALPRGEMAQAKLTAGHERRREHRYRLELPVRVAWRGPDGRRLEAQGLTQDLSRSGIYFIVPPEVRTDLPVEVDMILPDEITHRGDTMFPFLAQRVRQERVDSGNGTTAPSVGVAARLMARAEEFQPQAGSWIS